MSDLYEPCKYWDPFVERDCPLDEGEGEEEAPPDPPYMADTKCGRRVEGEG